MHAPLASLFYSNVYLYLSRKLTKPLRIESWSSPVRATTTKALQSIQRDQNTLRSGIIHSVEKGTRLVSHLPVALQYLVVQVPSQLPVDERVLL
jgi:hypothetical protein